MNEIDIMEQNLAKLLNQNISLPNLQVNEPADPFQKRQFGKKMKKSTLSAIDDMHLRIASLPKIDQITFKPKPISMSKEICVQQPKKTHMMQPQNDDEQMYMREIEGLMSRLRMNLQMAEQSCKQRIHRICTLNTGKQLQQKAEMVLGQLQASVDFIINDCLTFESTNKCSNQGRHDKENRKSSSNTLAKSSKRTEKQQKSIYQSVLEERKLRKSKKRII